jgi:hypothetical protein
MSNTHAHANKKHQKSHKTLFRLPSSAYTMPVETVALANIKNSRGASFLEPWTKGTAKCIAAVTIEKTYGNTFKIMQHYFVWRGRPHPLFD